MKIICCSGTHSPGVAHTHTHIHTFAPRRSPRVRSVHRALLWPRACWRSAVACCWGLVRSSLRFPLAPRAPLAQRLLAFAVRTPLLQCLSPPKGSSRPWLRFLVLRLGARSAEQPPPPLLATRRRRRLVRARPRARRWAEQGASRQTRPTHTPRASLSYSRRRSRRRAWTVKGVHARSPSPKLSSESRRHVRFAFAATRPPHARAGVQAPSQSCAGGGRGRRPAGRASDSRLRRGGRRESQAAAAGCCCSSARGGQAGCGGAEAQRRRRVGRGCARKGPTRGRARSRRRPSRR